MKLTLVQQTWWKWLIAIWLTLVICAGFLISIPNLPILKQTTRNIFFHVPMWFTMFVCFIISVYGSIRYLASRKVGFDWLAEAGARAGIAFGTAGLLTGSLWARFTWGTWWTFAEPRMNLAAVALLMYVAYLLLRSSVDDAEKRGRIAASYNIFAFTSAPFLFYIVPRQLSSLHPGAEGNPAFSEITSPEIRMVLYPAFIGFIALGMWITSLYYRQLRLSSEHN